MLALTFTRSVYPQLVSFITFAPNYVALLESTRRFVLVYLDSLF